MGSAREYALNMIVGIVRCGGDVDNVCSKAKATFDTGLRAGLRVFGGASLLKVDVFELLQPPGVGRLLE